MRVLQAGSSAVPSTKGVVKNKKTRYLSANEKAKNWDDGNVAKIVRDHLYPVAKIIFNSKEELQYDGHICNVIMEKITWDPTYDRLTDKGKDEHRRVMWSEWSCTVSKCLDTKRHNQKASLRKAFYGTYTDGTIKLSRL
jgi:hypothetical protein